MQFFKIVGSTQDPSPAAEDLGGIIPSRAHRWCEPFLAANQMGWHLYPPVDFSLRWDGREIYAEFEGIEETVKVDQVFLPGFADHWAAIAPDEIDVMPIFLEAFPEHGVLQVWTGFFLETRPRTSTWIRGPINGTRSSAYEIIEGIVETDWWSGPLFTNIRMLRTDEPVAFRRTQPWLQVFSIDTIRVHESRKEFLPVISGYKDIPLSFREKIVETARRRNSEKAGSYRRVSRARFREDPA